MYSVSRMIFSRIFLKYFFILGSIINDIVLYIFKHDILFDHKPLTIPGDYSSACVTVNSMSLNYTKPVFIVTRIFAQLLQLTRNWILKLFP